jgi:hypothetical protein
MDEKRRNRKGNIIVGGQRGGKSYYTNKLIKKYISGGASALVYNLGKESDFDCCELVTLLGYNEHSDLILSKGGKIALKRWKDSGSPFLYMETAAGVVFDIKEFVKRYKGKGIKCKRLSTKMEDAFFYAYQKYISNTILVFDDGKGIFKPNLREWQTVLVSSMNHTGKESIYKNYVGAGSDLIFIFHSIDHISSQLLDYYTDDYYFTNFACKELPEFERISNEELRDSLKVSFNALKTMPKYSYSVFYQGRTDLYTFKKDSIYTKKTFIIE